MPKLIKARFINLTVWFALLWVTPVWAVTFEFTKVTESVYAYVGPLENRTPENLGLNNNIGLVLTSQGAVLIDSGAGDSSAQVLEKAVKQITDKPIVAVINTGSQDHRWLGNGYFAEKGATLYALQHTVNTQQKMGAGLVEKMSRVSEQFATTKPMVSKAPFAGDSATLTIGDTQFELHYFGDAHFPGDAVVWLPEQKVLFSGDLIYVDRMLGVHPFSNVQSWQKAFHQAEKLPAKFIVPGHGQIADWDLARQDTGNYLDKLVVVISEAADEMKGVDEVVSENADWPEFNHLEHYDSWHKTILNRTFLQFEAAM